MSFLKLDPPNIILLVQKQELLQSVIGDTKKKLEALEQDQEDVVKAFERGPGERPVYGFLAGD